MYPAELVGPERMRDTMYAIYAIVSVAMVFSVIWIFAWRAYWRNQGHYNSIAEKQNSTGSAFSCPLSLTGDILSINRGFSVQTVDLRAVRWIHMGIALINSGWTGASSVLEIHYIDGRKSSFLIHRRKYSSSVDEIIDTIVGVC
ncbi:hypothetical protein AGMMS49983_21950 [Clostridia bacterium]|nr:hypothetical protein AGMMS49983_21950 [Clostridia bacterium]